MKRVFFFGVIAYSVLIFLLNDLPTAVGLTGVTAAPWIGKCLVDICFGFAGVFALFGDKIEWDDDEEGIHADDVKIPSQWLYGIFGLNLLANFGWHGYEFAMTSGAESLYNGGWFFGEFIAMVLTLILWQHAHKIAKRDQRRAREAARASGSSPINRNVA